MAEFGFGQRTGQIMQMAYVVEDIRAAMNWWLMDETFTRMYMAALRWKGEDPVRPF